MPRAKIAPLSYTSRISQIILMGHFWVVLCLFFNSRPGAQPFLWKWVLFACEWKLIFPWKAEHQDSIWKRGTWQLGNINRISCDCHIFSRAFSCSGSVAQSLHNFILFCVVISATIWHPRHILSFSCHLLHFAEDFVTLSYTKMTISLPFSIA